MFGIGVPELLIILVIGLIIWPGKITGNWPWVGKIHTGISQGFQWHNGRRTGIEPYTQGGNFSEGHCNK